MGLDPYVGEIAMFGGTFAPQGWSFCDGSLLNIADYTALFTLIGTTYGGDGQVTFAVPDLRGRIPVHQGQSSGTSAYVLGQMGGTESEVLTSLQIPAHTHTILAASDAATATNPANNYLASQTKLMEYNTDSSANATMKANALSTFNGGSPHNNMMPVLCVNFIISLEGIYPPQN